MSSSYTQTEINESNEKLINNSLKDGYELINFKQGEPGTRQYTGAVFLFCKRGKRVIAGKKEKDLWSVTYISWGSGHPVVKTYRRKSAAEQEFTSWARFVLKLKGDLW